MNERFCNVKKIVVFGFETFKFQTFDFHKDKNGSFMIKVLCNKNGKFGYRMKSLSDEIEDDESEPNETDDAQAV